MEVVVVSVRWTGGSVFPPGAGSTFPRQRCRGEKLPPGAGSTSPRQGGPTGTANTVPPTTVPPTTVLQYGTTQCGTTNPGGRPAKIAASRAQISCGLQGSRPRERGFVMFCKDRGLASADLQCFAQNRGLAGTDLSCFAKGSRLRERGA